MKNKYIYKKKNIIFFRLYLGVWRGRSERSLEERKEQVGEIEDIGRGALGVNISS